LGLPVPSRVNARSRGIAASATSIRTVLLRDGLSADAPPGIRHLASGSAAQASAIVAADFFTVETVCLKTLDVLLLIQAHTRGFDSPASPIIRTDPWVGPTGAGALDGPYRGRHRAAVSDW
jgi:hypothetical protein